MIICFLGNDGSGKTAYALKIYQQLQKNGFTCKYLHLESLFIGKILEFKNNFNNNESLGNNILPHDNSRNTGFFKYLVNYIKIVMFMLDNLSFYILKMKWNMDTNTILILDRYFYDTIISSIILKTNPYLIEKIYLKIFPLPEAIILLNIDYKTACHRKGELIFETNQDLFCKKSNIYNNFCSKLSAKLLIVESSSDFDICHNEIEKWISIILEDR